MTKSDFSFDSRLDIEFLSSVYEGDLEHAQMIFEQFIELTPQQMSEIELTYVSGAVEVFRQKVHKLKPIFSFVGLTRLSEQAEVIEKKCKEIASLAEVDHLYGDFKNNYTVYFPVIENELKRLKS